MAKKRVDLTAQEKRRESAWGGGNKTVVLVEEGGHFYTYLEKEEGDITAQEKQPRAYNPVKARGDPPPNSKTKIMDEPMNTTQKKMWITYPIFPS